MANFIPKCGYEYIHPLTKEIVARIPDSIRYGNYQFGDMIDGEFKPQYVGRSVSGLKGEIEQQRHLKVDEGDATYKFFRYCRADSAREAYENECIDYHANGENEFLDNIDHPAKLPGTEFPCPVEGCEYNEE